MTITVIMRQKRYRHRNPSLKSPFLNLPAEIRDQIYQHALISPSAIDLCPAIYVSSPDDFDQDPKMKQRYLAFVKANTPPPVDRGWWDDILPPRRVAFRLQSGLVHVRKHLVPQLLQVCCQIYNEAAEYFWGGNVWCFMDDDGWVILWRFLLTIGPRARSMIQKLDVVAPYLCRVTPLIDGVRRWQVKNHPKLQMAKIWRPFEGRECQNVVYKLWMCEKTLPALDFYMPARHRLYEYLQGFNAFWVDEDSFSNLLPKIRVIVESGGILYDWKSITLQGWDLVKLPGGRVFESILDSEEVGDAMQIWESDLDYLTGVSQLFRVEDPLSVHSNDGKAKTLKRPRKVERVLNAFGPCMIVVEDWRCGCSRCTSHHVFDGFCPEYITTKYRSLIDA